MQGLTPLQRQLAAALAVVTAAWFAAWAAFPLAEAWRTAAIDVLWVAVPALAGALALASARRPDERARRALTLLGAGAVAWAAGQLLWTVHELGGGTDYPAAMDVPYGISLLLFAVAVAAWPRTGGRRGLGDLLDFGIVLGVGFLFSYEFILGSVLEHGRPALLQVGLLLYPLGDLLLGATIVAGLLVGRFAQPARLAAIGLGMGALVVADTFFALTIDTYAAGSVFDVGWTLAFVAIAVAAVLPAHVDERIRIPTVAAPGRALALLVVVGAFLLTEHDTGSPGEGVVDTGIGAALFGLLAVRYVGLGLERLREQRRLDALGRQLEREVELRAATLELSRTGVCVLDGTGAAAFANTAWRALGAPVLAEVADRLLGREPQLRTERGGRVLAFSAERLASGETVVSVDDVTDEERERETRDRFLAQVVRAQDLEARRIAELLHDDAVQQLTALSLRLELAAMQRGDDELGGLARDAGSITASLRRLLIDLYPAVLESQGLAAAVDAAAEGARLLGVDVRVGALDRRLEPEVEQLAYRLVQEALANVVGHAGASRVQIALELDDGRLRCSVDDDGVGARPEDVELALRRGSLGLHLVRERVELAGGSFDVAPLPAGGTRFAFSLPAAATTDRLDERTGSVVPA